MNRRHFGFAVGAFAAGFTSGCSTLRALGQYDRIGTVRQDLIDWLPEFYLRSVQADLQFLDDTYAEVQKVLNRDPDVTLLDVLVLALGSPAAFSMVGTAYGNIRGTVLMYSQQHPTEPIPASLVSFDAGVSPAYKEIQRAINANDTLKKGALLAEMLKPLVVVLL